MGLVFPFPYGTHSKARTILAPREGTLPGEKAAVTLSSSTELFLCLPCQQSCHHNPIVAPFRIHNNKEGKWNLYLVRRPNL